MERPGDVADSARQSPDPLDVLVRKIEALPEFLFCRTCQETAELPDEPVRLAGVLGEFVQLELRYRATVVVLGQEAAEPDCFVRRPL